MRQTDTRALPKDNVLLWGQDYQIQSHLPTWSLNTRDINTDSHIDTNTYKVIEENMMRRQEAKPKGIRKQTCICQNMFHWSHEMLHIYTHSPRKGGRVGQEKFWLLYMTTKHQKIDTLISSMMKQKHLCPILQPNAFQNLV